MQNRTGDLDLTLKSQNQIEKLTQFIIIFNLLLTERFFVCTLVISMHLIAKYCKIISIRLEFNER